MKYRMISLVVIAACLVCPAGWAENLGSVRKLGSSDHIIGTSNGSTVSSTTDAPPLLQEANGKETSLGGYNFLATGINSFNEVVGFKDGDNTDYSEDDSTDYAFFATKGQESVILVAAPYIVGIALNDAHRVVVAEKDKLSFFNSTAPVSTTVVPVTMEIVGVATILQNGNVLLKVTDAGTPHFAIGTSSGIVVLSEDILPIASQEHTVLTNGTLRFINLTQIFESDLKSPPVKSTLLDSKKSAALQLSSDGGILVGSDAAPSLVQNGQPTAALGCFITNKILKVGQYIQSVVLLNTSSAVLTLSPGENVLVHYEPGMKNYCTSLVLSVDKACSFYFEEDQHGGLITKHPFTRKIQCGITARVRNAEKKPLAKVVIKTGYAPQIKRGVTKEDGKVTFSMNFDEKYFDITVNALSRRQLYQAAQSEIHAS